MLVSPNERGEECDPSLCRSYVANLVVSPTNSYALQYAVNVLKVPHIIVQVTMTSVVSPASMERKDKPPPARKPAAQHL
jgi:hypothetical protein